MRIRKKKLAINIEGKTPTEQNNYMHNKADLKLHKWEIKYCVIVHAKHTVPTSIQNEYFNKHLCEIMFPIF